MAPHNRHSSKYQSELVMDSSLAPHASNIDPYDEDNEAQEKRRAERRERKKQERRRGQIGIEDEGDPDALLEEPKKQRRKKKKKQRPDIWYDERFEDEDDEFDEALEYDTGRNSRRKDDDDWYDG